MPRRLAVMLALLLAPTAPRVSHAAWPVTGYPLCNVPEDLNAPIGLPGYICDFHCVDSFTRFWQDGRSAYGPMRPMAHPPWCARDATAAASRTGARTA